MLTELTLTIIVQSDIILDKILTILPEYYAFDETPC